MLAIIGGTGAGQLADLQNTRREVIRTPYGEPSGALTFGVIAGHDVVFIARHGYGHTLPPHQINYRANIWALAQQKPDAVIAIASVGGIRADLQPGALVIPDQIIDYSHGRHQTYFESGHRPVTHIDFTEPYDRALRQQLLAAAQAENIALIDGGTYACTQGPRLETTAEIRRIERDGGDMVGMTGMPEAALARELGLHYATLAVVSNWAAGKGDSNHNVTFDLAGDAFQGALRQITRILSQLART
ncbi:S-methyl-5'-thioinosine phosphorylase [Amantichitinum ursilacus]|uniref:Probable 6-oxopurine nucleoside phosphorylase n=1 Tax=Amantichitinum ursilacus TaxID=857265 RepID=A0A0N0XJW9_9NEIS|nr:S-methyl-5'-thioinosine phosphorylase [Amantichitinum ursilacus]KPC52690.1 S-methyl-5'-thioinosine phosphorylase [Amantichitinum ursilacus]